MLCTHQPRESHCFCRSRVKAVVYCADHTQISVVSSCTRRRADSKEEADAIRWCKFARGSEKLMQLHIECSGRGRSRRDDVRLMQVKCPARISWQRLSWKDRVHWQLLPPETGASTAGDCFFQTVVSFGIASITVLITLFCVRVARFRTAVLGVTVDTVLVHVCLELFRLFPRET